MPWRSGRFTPLFEPLYHYAPGFNKFRGWSKFIYPATLFLVMLAAIGLDALLRRGSSSRVLAVVMTGGAACLFSAGFWAGWSAHVGSVESPRPWDDWLQTLYYSGDSMKWNAQILDPPGVQAAATVADHALLLAASTLLLLAAVFFAGRRWPQAVYLVPLIALAEILHFALPMLRTFDFVPARRDEAARFLASHPVGDDRVLDLDEQNMGMTTGENDIWGYDPGVTARYAELVCFTQGFAPDEARQEPRFKVVPNLFASLLRCRYVFGLPQENANGIDFQGFDPAVVSPHVMLVPTVSIVTGRDNILNAICPPVGAEFKPRETVILETPPEPLPAAHPGLGKVAITAQTTDSLTIEADLTDPEVLVVTDVYSDGWKARSLLPVGQGSGQMIYHVMPADYCVRGIPLAAGHHRLLLEYRPTAFLVGAWVSAASVLCYAIAVGWVFLYRAKDANTAATAV